MMSSSARRAVASSVSRAAAAAGAPTPSGPQLTRGPVHLASAAAAAQTHTHSRTQPGKGQDPRGWAVAAAAAMVGSAGLCSATAEHPGPALPRLSIYDLPLGKKFPNEIPCFIEVAKGSRNKYEWDDKIGFLRLDRVLHSAVFYPHNYGFFPQTLCGDGDPLDVLVLGEELVPGAIVDVRSVGYMIMEDEKGLDEKVLAVPVDDPRFDEYKTLRDVPEHLLREIAHFFSTYKALEKKKWAKVGGWKGTEDTLLLIEETHKAYVQAKAKANPTHRVGTHSSQKPPAKK